MTDNAGDIIQYNVSPVLYVHWLSNHAPASLKNIPRNINKRLTDISSSEQVFNEAIPQYQQALDESGYNFKFKCAPQEKQVTRKSEAPKRKITWYNPPWDSYVKTNLGRKFLLVTDKCFPKNHSLNKIVNRHTLKLSYLCMANMKAIISSHKKNMPRIMALRLHTYNKYAHVNAKIDQNPHSKKTG